MKNNTFILMHTLGCHLCEDAEALLQNPLVSYTKQDIADDDDLMQRYATRIPVLLHPNSSQELSWPFDRSQLSEFIQYCS